MVKPADEPKVLGGRTSSTPNGQARSCRDDYRAPGGGAVFFMVMYDAFGREFHEKLAAQKFRPLARHRQQ